MGEHHILRSRVIRQRYATGFALAISLAAIGMGLSPRNTAPADLLPYVIAVSLAGLAAGIGIMIYRRNVHTASGVASDLIYAVLLSASGFMLLAAFAHMIR